MGNNMEHALIVTYYLSKYETAYKDLGYRTQKDCFESISRILNIKASSIRNMRDEFDPINDNNRAGFKSRDLSPSRKRIADKYSTYTERELRDIVKSILDAETEILKDLNKLAKESKIEFNENFAPVDVVLTDDFKRELGSHLRKNKSDVEFFNATSVITTPSSKTIYVPNQWYLMATYMVDYVKALFEYKEHLYKIFQRNNMNTEQIEKLISSLKKGDATEETINNISFECDAYFTELESGDVSRDVEYMIKFLSDYNWWNGSKTIDRGDFFVSPVLALLGVVNASQGYIADICNIYAENKTLEKLAKEQQSQIRTNANTAFVPKVLPPVIPCLTGGVNLIVYGAPGTGKSRFLDDNYGGDNTIRVVFHPEYTYFDFVGSYKPVPLYKTGIDLLTVSGEVFPKGEPVIDYQFVPGPFITTLINAYLKPAEMHTLLIEEINRANAASVFGEIFQLLDRNSDGSGEYQVSLPKDINDYLNGINCISAHIASGVKMPSNVNIVATMNSADQGVTLLDSAFKRRWNFKYIKVSVEGAVHEKAQLTYGGVTVFWGDFINAINEKLKDLRIDEDRLVGPYFIRPDEVGKSAAIDKLLLYLWDDVLRHHRDTFFDSGIRTFSDLAEGFECSDVMLLSVKPARIPILSDIEQDDDSDDDAASDSDGE